MLHTCFQFQLAPVKHGIIQPDAGAFPITVEIEYDPAPGLTGFYNSASQPNLMFTFLKAASVVGTEVGRCKLKPC